MATPQTIITRALRMLGQATPTSDELTDGLEVLNDLVDSWKNEHLLTYARREETLTLSSADASYTIGPSGDLTTTRPTEIEAAWIVEDDQSYPVRVIADGEYAAIADKTQAGDWPEVLNYKATMANGTIAVWPVPNATRTLMLLTRVPLVEFSTLGETVSLPPGFRRALSANLAIDLAPEFETEPSPSVVKMAGESKALIKRQNAQPIKSASEVAALVGGSTANIVSGT